MSWIAICLPQLPIEVFAAAPGQALAVDDGKLLLHVNEVARCAGVDPGMRRATGLALCPALRLLARDLARERAALQAVAMWAQQFTPNVSLVSPDEELPDLPGGVLLEVRGSLRLFGGLAPILRAVARGLTEQHHVAQLAAAPVPQAAWLLARAPRNRGAGSSGDRNPAVDHRGAGNSGDRNPATNHRGTGDTGDRNPATNHRGTGDTGDPSSATNHRGTGHTGDGSVPAIAAIERLRDALRPLPVWLLGPGSRYWDKLQNVGLKTIGDLLELPRSGIARRFSEALLDELDRALGERPDPRAWFKAPPAFDTRVELAARVDSAEALLFAARRLVLQLAGWLTSRHAATRMLVFTLVHEDRAPTSLPLQLADASDDAERFTALLREVLGRAQLVAPVYELGLACSDVVAAQASSAQFFPAPRAEHEGLMRLLERLQARLGRRQVTRLRLHDEYRPEHAFRSELATGEPRSRTVEVSPRPARPLWLLPEPIALVEWNNAPVFGSPLSLVSGPERIEGGWWDGAWVERDYFVARDGDNALLWIFRLRSPAPGTQQGWYLHGKFG